MSNCVNKSSKEFKDCCKRLNVSPTTLEPIIHEYINIEGNENSFPSDVYIEERIHGKSMEVLEDAQVQLWENRYSQPKVFNTQEEALAYYNECNKYFPKESIGLKETLDGKYEVTVKRPVVVSQNYLETKFQEEETTKLLETFFFNKKEETAVKEEIKQEQSNQEIIKGELGVNKQQLISLLGSTMYQSGRQEVAIKEILQNAFDAVKIAKSKGQIEDGKIDIELDTTKRTIKIQDNGIGMTPQIVQKAFFTIGGSYKGDNVDNSLKSGGLGLAKMAFLFGSEYVEVTTIKDGVKTYVRATPEEIQNDNFNIVTSKTTESNGTTVEVKIPENYLDNNGELKSIYFSYMPSFLNEPMIGDVTINTHTITGWSNETKTSDKSQIPEGYHSIGKATADFGDIEIYIKPKKSNSKYLRCKVLNSGLYQFSNTFKLNQETQFEVILNILPKVTVEDVVYPINNQREGFRATIQPEVDSLVFFIDRINNILTRQTVASTFENALSMDVKSVAKVERKKADVEKSISDIRKEIQKTFSGKTTTSKTRGTGEEFQNIEVSLTNVTRVKDEEKQRSSSLDTSGIKIKEEEIKVNTNTLDIAKPIFHNNTSMVIEEDGQLFLKELGILLLELKDLYSQTYRETNIKSRHGKQIVDFISQQYWGISFDKNYGGVNVNPSLFNFLGINPFYRVVQYEGVDTALMLTEYITHLIKHEFNHNYASGEGAEFTGRFPATDAEFAGIGTQFNKEWKNKLYSLIKTNLETIIKYADKYEKATNLGGGFREENLTSGKESSNSSVIDDGTDIQGDGSREDVQNNGGEFDAIIQEFIGEQLRGDKEQKETQQKNAIKEEKQQIKQKAIDNIGTFSTSSDNIYYNLSSKSITKDLKDKGLIHSYNGELYVTKKGIESLEDVENYFIEKMMRLGYSEDSYDLDRTTNGVRVTINDGSRKVDYIESEVNHTFSTIENTIKFLEEKIPALKGKVHYNVTIKEAKEVLGDKYDNSINSFVHNGKIYLIKSRVTQDIAIEEALHILTESLIVDNLELAQSLLHEAQKLFPQLVDEIRRTYEGTSNQNREILTQALARVFRQEFNEGERQTAESILSKFINWIKQLFGINPTTGNTIIELDELSTDMTLRDFAQLINSSNAEFKTWSHNKTQFNKSSKGELISSSAKSSAFARQLTNPGNNLTVEYKGRTFRNAEHAYQTWKSGEFDEKAYKSKAFKPVGSKKVNTAVNFDIMVEILTAKLQQHPELIEGINERGGLDYILNSTHEVTGDKYWESSGENKFIEALAKAYNNTLNVSKNNIETQEENLTQDEIDTKANKEAELDAVFQNTLQLTEQLKNIQDSGLISTSEFTQLANDVAYYISDLITSWQENPEEFKQSAPTLAAEIDVRTLSRRELVEKIGVPKLLDVVKKALFGKRIPGVDARKTLLLFKNFDALIRFGSSAFNTVEDFQISYSEIGYTVSDKVESTENENLSNEENAVIEENGDKQEHWQIDSRTVDTFLTMSQAVKKELARCYKLNSDGTISKNEFGINERISPRDATSCILRWTQGSLTLSDMITKLESKQENNPWIKPIIEKLRDTSGKYSDFQSQFFGVFCKHFQEYYIVKEFNDNGNRVLRIMPVNRTPALNEIMTSIEVLFKLKAHPMFNNHGLIKEKLDELKSYVSSLNDISKGEFDTLPLDRISKGIAKIADLLGYKTTDEMVILALTPESLYNIKKALSYIVSNLEKGLGDSNYNPFSFNKENKNGIRNNLKDFLQPLTEVLEDLAISSFFESGKMYQSYVIPSYMTKLMRKFQNSNEQEFKEFMQKEYGQYEWFRDQSRDIEDPNSWKNDWLRQLYFMSNENRKKLFGHKVQLSFVGHNYMRNMTGPEYVMAIMTEFFSGSKDSKETIIPTWYKIPMLSNKPSLEFVKFARYRGIGYEETILDGLQQVFIQELGRIIEVKNRAYSTKDDRHIKNFDTNGQKFCFLDFLNDYLGSKAHTELGILLDKKINFSEQLTIEEENKLFDLVRKEINSFMTKKSNEIIQSYKNSGLFEVVKKIDGIGNTDVEIESNLKNFIWNDTYASMMILQMTITDIAYYANAEDLQKRLAQIHAPGIRPNVEAMDYGEYDEVGRLIKKAERVCDGNLRTIFLKDFEGDAVVQNVIENLEVVFSRKENEAKTDVEKEYWKTTKEAIIDAFKDVNVTDAQAYNSITSYRKKAIMFGKWSSKNEEIYKKLKKGDWNISDLETIFQPLKPFVYTNSTKESVGSRLKVGMQFKNAEYALLIADAILRNEDTGKPNLLKVLSEIMEESADKTPKRDKGIDTIMFASAVKAGLHGRLDIANFKDEKAAKDYLEYKIYGDGADGYNETYVHTFPAEDYSIQQDYSPHFLDHSQADGSQKRMIIPSDLATVDTNGNPVLYTFKDGDETKSLNAEEFKKEYEETYAENIESSLNELEVELGLNLPTKKLRNIALSQVLQKEILSSPRYGIDLYIACSVDKDGNFNIPLGDPIQSKRIEQLINSIVKNRLNKQKIKGGPVVQVSNFGSKRLNIKFKDKKGNILPTTTEWLEKNPEKTVEDFKKFLEDNQAGVAYYECYAPAYMQEVFEVFMDENGFIDWEAINEVEPEMLEMIGFRIPTEDLYSIAPMKITGFLPKEAGEALMLPYEITVIWGADFDWDKAYLQRKEFIIKMNSRRVVSVDKPTKGKAYRNNKIIDMSLAVLTHETSAHRMLNPGGFEPQKRMGYLVSAVILGKGTYEQLSKLSTNALKKLCMTDKNLSFIDINTQFYEQNNAAGSILGMFAVQKIAHATLENNGLYLDVNKALQLAKNTPFVFCGKSFYGLVEFDPTLNNRGEYIGKVLGSLVASAADAVKDPVLNLMNINSTTANVLTTMIRFGIPFEQAALLTSQKIIGDCLKEFNVRNLEGYVNFATVIEEKLIALRDNTGITEGDDVNTEELTEKELIEGLVSDNPKIQYKALLAFSNFMTMANELKGPTFATRFNSISNAVGPQIVDNLIMANKMTQFSSNIRRKVGDNIVEIDINDVFNMHPILKQFARGLETANRLFGGHMPLLSQDFQAVLNSLPEGIENKIYGDRKLLSKLADFYLSYLLINSGCIDTTTSKGLDYYINNFPKEFFETKIKEKHPNNPFIQAIMVETTKTPDGGERFILKLETTGMETTDKEKLSAGWEDLAKEDFNLCMKLFKYCFYKGGIGFTPKTFMHLLPNSIKKEIPKYIESFKAQRVLHPEYVVDQFIRNNWQNNKLVPKIQDAEDFVDFDESLSFGIVDENYHSLFKELNYCKIKLNGKDVLFKINKFKNEANQWVIQLVKTTPLGNNGEYLEVSKSNIEKTMDNTEIAIDDNTPDSPNAMPDVVENTKVSKTDKENQYYLDLIARVITQDKVAEFKAKSSDEQQSYKLGMKKFFTKAFAKHGIEFNMDNFDKLWETFCN